MSEIECRVDVWKEEVTDIDSCFGSFCDTGPDVRFLGDGGENVVVTVKREEGRELHPAVAEFLVGVAVKTACVLDLLLVYFGD